MIFTPIALLFLLLLTLVLLGAVRLVLSIAGKKRRSLAGTNHRPPIASPEQRD